MLAGNCNTALGSVAGLDHLDRTGVVWFDAHGDFNTPETTVTGSFDGMALAMLTGRCWTGLYIACPAFLRCKRTRHASSAPAISIPSNRSRSINLRSGACLAGCP